MNEAEVKCWDQCFKVGQAFNLNMLNKCWLQSKRISARIKKIWGFHGLSWKYPANLNIITTNSLLLTWVF